MHNVYAGDDFGNRVFYLYARVHFNEEKFAIFVQEFKRARAAVVDAFTGRYTRFTNGFALCFGNAWGRGFFDDFLVATLHRAIALSQVNGIAVFIRQNLNFHVTRFLQIAFHVNGRIAKRRTCFGFGHFNRQKQVFFTLYHAHATATTTACGFDDDWVAHFAADSQDFGRVFRQSAIRTRYTRHASGFHRIFGGHFVAHGADGVATWADEYKTRLLHAVGKVCVFRQETITWVYGFGASDFGSSNDGRNV